MGFLKSVARVTTVILLVGVPTISRAVVVRGGPARSRQLARSLVFRDRFPSPLAFDETATAP